MAADVTLIALPATDENWYRTRLMTYQELLPGDEVFRDENGEILSVCSDDAATDERMKTYHLPGIDVFEVGPVSYLKSALLESDTFLPAPTVAVHALWGTPQVLTPGRLAKTMVTLNRPDRSHYRKWPRKARRQHVKRWLTGHLGDIVWAETW